MTNYLFVPGGMGQSEDEWNDVRSILESHGHRTYAITLSNPEHSNLSDHITEVCNMIANTDLHGVWLAGHSYAGFIITGVTNAIPEKIAKLIYIDSAIPENGKSLFDYFRLAVVDPEKYGVPELPPFTEPLFFDQSLINKIPKTYIHCTYSQFLAMTRTIPQFIKEHAEQDNWEYFDLDADHSCMLTNPGGLADILLRS